MFDALYHFTVPEEKRIRVLIDTDTKNEADDPFAVVHALLSPRMIQTGLIATHFRANQEPDSMEQSYAELVGILDQMGVPAQGLLCRGAPGPMPDCTTPVISEGAAHIVEEAMSNRPERLYVLMMGALTDLASALLIEPRIAKRLTAVWVGGGAYPHGGQEFNLSNDLNAANVVFASDMELWQIPKNVYEQMAVSLAELQLRVEPRGELGQYLFRQLAVHAITDIPKHSVFRSGESWVLGDNSAVGLMLYEHRFLFDWVPAPIVTREQTYAPSGRSRPIRVYRSLDSRLILEDFYAKLALFASQEAMP